MSILAAIVFTVGIVQFVAGAREVAQDQTVSGVVVTSSRCSTTVRTAYAGGSVWPVDVCAGLSAGTPVRLTFDGQELLVVQAGSSDIAVSAGEGASNQDDGLRTGLAGLGLLAFVGLLSSAAVRRVIKTVWVRIV